MAARKSGLGKRTAPPIPEHVLTDARALRSLPKPERINPATDLIDQVHQGVALGEIPDEAAHNVEAEIVKAAGLKYDEYWGPDLQRPKEPRRQRLPEHLRAAAAALRNIPMPMRVDRAQELINQARQEGCVDAGRSGKPPA